MSAKMPGRALVEPDAPLLVRELIEFLLTVPGTAWIKLVSDDFGAHLKYDARHDTVEIHGEVES